MRGGRKGNEELTPVHVGALVRHAQDASRIVAQRRRELVFEQAAIIEDGVAGLGLGVVGGAAALDHEVGDQTVERRAIVEVRGAQGEEVLGGPGGGFAEELELDVALGGVQLQGGLVSVTERHNSVWHRHEAQGPDAPVSREPWGRGRAGHSL